MSHRETVCEKAIRRTDRSFLTMGAESPVSMLGEGVVVDAGSVSGAVRPVSVVVMIAPGVGMVWVEKVTGAACGEARDPRQLRWS